MVPDDDFLLAKPGHRESVTVLRIALMALAGCLLLLSVLIIQARAEPGAELHRTLGTALSPVPAQCLNHKVGVSDGWHPGMRVKASC
ncbi:MAG: hypothetical protein ABJN75_23255 [Hoeflea sp.]|uniref:hypothetical protein n=1 Tax=Hoeflea sp. TaxID=1940281 RepID=UPI003298ABF6